MNLDNYGEAFHNASLENYNTYGIKTHARYLIKPDSYNNVLELIKYLNNKSISYYILGKGSNVILPDKDFDGVIISLEKMNSYEINGNVVSADAGINLSLLSKYVVASSLSGFENLALIPGTLGGAIVGNAGAYGKDIFEYLESVELIRNNEILTLMKKDIKYGYRYTEFKGSTDIILGAKFILPAGNTKKMDEFIKECAQKRRDSQPLEYKNAGSVFKNPDGFYAGKLIEDLGLKGMNVGGASISNKHANFIISDGTATSKDILELIKIIKDKVKDAYNIELELEQVIIKW